MFKKGQLVRDCAGSRYVISCVGHDEEAGEDVLALLPAPIVNLPLLYRPPISVMRATEVQLIGNNYKAKG